MTRAIAEPSSDLAADEDPQALSQGDRGRRAFAQREGPLEVDDEVRRPGEPEERAEEARAHRGERRAVVEDERVERAHPRLAVRSRSVRQAGEEHARRDDRQRADDRDRNAPAGRLRDDPRDRYSDDARHGVHADHGPDRLAPLPERERVRDRRVRVREDDRGPDAGADARGDDEREARRDGSGEGRQPHDERADDEERLAPDAIRVRPRQQRDRDARRAVRRDHEAGRAGRDPELARHLLEDRAHDEPVVDRREREEADDQQESAPLGRAQSRLCPANACRNRPNARMWSM